MRRVGAKKKPRFRVVVIEADAAPDGAALEVLGHYNPTAEPETVVLDRERLRHWLDRGAQLSDTVRTMVARHPETAADAAAEAPDAIEEPPAAEDTAAKETAAAAPPADEPPATDGAATEAEAS
ncbi:MAG: 30S ribosomal protein S16 [Acidobacteria bacterium]|nr:30S ribosomal protein S16 [Acidobacteriota bacterium]